MVKRVLPPCRPPASVVQAPAGEAQEDVLEGAPADEHRLGVEPAPVHLVDDRVAVVRAAAHELSRLVETAYEED